MKDAQQTIERRDYRSPLCADLRSKTMKDVDSWSAERGDTVHHHAENEELNRMAECEYQEHIKANRPSVSEGLVIVGAFLMLGAAALTVNMGGSVASAVDRSPVGSIAESAPALDYCREHSPYADKSC
jgi:hypothetical protein